MSKSNKRQQASASAPASGPETDTNQLVDLVRELNQTVQRLNKVINMQTELILQQQREIDNLQRRIEKNEMDIVAINLR